MRLYDTFTYLISLFNKSKVDYALIGGLSLAYWGIGRNTIDIDFLVSSQDILIVKKTIEDMGYSLIYGSEEVIQFQFSDNSRPPIDILIAHRKYSNNMLLRSDLKYVDDLEVKVLIPEDIIGLKLQAYCNDSSREVQDKADIENLIRNNLDNIDWEKIEDYYDIFDLMADFHELRRRFVS